MVIVAVAMILIGLSGESGQNRQRGQKRDCGKAHQHP
jgi:hypothetical protein